MRAVPVSAVGLALLSAIGCGGGSGDVHTIDFESCMRDLTNIAHFAETPIGQAGLVSTYDRTGGNSDWAQGLTAGPDGLTEIARITGPGCMRRLWHTSVPANEWLFFFDGEATPRVRLTNGELFGGKPPFVVPLSARVSGGHYCYVPMPFEKSLRVCLRARRWAKGYYHINYETYGRNVEVISFPSAMTVEQQELARRVAGAWRNESAVSPEPGPVSASLTISPGQVAPLLSHEGGGILKSFGMTLRDAGKLTPLARTRLLRELVLRIYWDGSSRASVNAPLGDFFCNAFHYREYRSAPLSYTNGVYACRFPMPFASSVKVELGNDGSSPVDVGFSHVLEERAPQGRISYFHARWAMMRSSGVPFTLLDTTGEGHYVGCYLSAVGVDGNWKILEGDESFRIDGESSPSLHGTGLEDYFNGAWYYTGIFDLPLHGLLEKAAMRTDQYRFHLADAVRFRKSLGVQFEFGEANRSMGYMSGVAFWYQSSPAPAGSSVPAAASRFLPPDRVEPATIMARLFELERIGHLAEARTRCLEYAEKFNGTELAALLLLRAAAYREALGRKEQALAGYRDILSKVASGPVNQQARTLTWFHEDPRNVLLGLNVNGRYRLFLDGKEVSKGDNPLSLKVIPLTVEPGEHEFRAEVQPTRGDAWFSVCLRTHAGDILSDDTWECCDTKPGGWPLSTARAGVEWKPVWVHRENDMLPRIGFWQLAPNAFVQMQSGRQLLRPWRKWGAISKRATAYLRKKFVIPQRKQQEDQ